MSKDVFIDENEIKIAVNKIERNVDFLQRSIDDCIAQMNTLVTMGIKDESITKQIETAKQRLKAISNQLGDSVSSFTSAAKKQEKEIESSDCFVYGNFMTLSKSPFFKILR